MPPMKSAAPQSINPARPSAATKPNRDSDPPVLGLGDLMLMGTPPAKLLKALAVIASELHPAFDALPGITPGISRRSCVLCSLTVRDFLQRIGIAAVAAPVVAVLAATEKGQTLHTAGIGVPGQVPRPRNWNGHMIVVVPEAEYLIDTTLYQINRPAWSDLPGMVATPIIKQMQPGHGRMWGLDVLTSIQMTEAERDYEFQLTWLANPRNNAWRNGPDARRDLRRPAVAKLAHTFGSWREERK